MVAAVLCFCCRSAGHVCTAAGDYAGQVNALIPAATRNAKPTKVKDDLRPERPTEDGEVRPPEGRLGGWTILSLGSNSELRVVQHDAASRQTP
jgi:hypothetical protein